MYYFRAKGRVNDHDRRREIRKEKRSRMESEKKENSNEESYEWLFFHRTSIAKLLYDSLFLYVGMYANLVLILNHSLDTLVYFFL